MKLEFTWDEYEVPEYNPEKHNPERVFAMPVSYTHLTLPTTPYV